MTYPIEWRGSSKKRDFGILRHFIWSLLFLLPFSATAFLEGHWTIVGDKKTPVDLIPGQAYPLQNVANKDVLRAGEQTFGVNLKNRKLDDEPPDKQGNMVFSRADQIDRSALKYGERISIQVTDRPKPDKFLRYGHRDRSIYLDWSETPVYEWEIRGGACG